MVVPSVSAIRRRVVDEFLAARLLDNNLRGYWCEAMVAEAIGPACKIVSGGWHAWDLQIGPDAGVFPRRLRIQVKNSTRLQSWNVATGKPSETIFQLTWRRRPYYFARDFPGVPCEETGFMCDLFILCHHPVEIGSDADHRDPEQWEFYLLPAVGPKTAITGEELLNVKRGLEVSGKPSSTHRRPRTLRQGIRGRPPVEPIRIDALTLEALWQAVS